MRLTSLNDITTKHRHIFLSPHFDDVIYSCGGTLGVQVSSGLRPLVLTVFGGIPAPDTQLSSYATAMHREMGADPAKAVGNIVEVRRQEDAAACDFLQADYLWLDYLDAPYRGTPAYYTTEEALIGGEVHSSDLWIDKNLAEDLLALRSRLPDAVWYAPLGIGRHVDHQIVCSAADRLVQSGAKVYFYEDFPYVLRNPQARDARLQELGQGFDPVLVEMSEMLPLRQTAADKYETQTLVNFESQAAMHAEMARYTHSIRPVETVHLERYWQPR
ncbi:PIG-L deacetylase family protein [Ktedonosporobacter rubrisoli]|uniref:PIG-L deacetylase family protein n=1 Tax=Ktedonosporobacter rubrisoli TaxID=2509675 RepID=UPI0013EE99B4|nr:PIG-L family deacetylase [Ktedonosporobacter rubrisoli]